MRLVSALPPLAALAGAGFRRYTTYRAAMIGGAVTNSVFGLLRASILAATIHSRGGDVGGYDAASAVTFAWMTQALIAVVEVFSWQEIALRVRTGDIAVDLARPVDLQLAYGAADVGRGVAVLLPRSLPIMLVGAVVTGLALPRSAWPYLLGAVAVLFATVLSFACRFVVNLAAFWIVEVRGVVGFYVLLSTLLSGLVLPITWFPPWLRLLASLTPFPSMVQTPADVLLGRLSGMSALSALGVQVGWLVVVGAVGRLALAAGSRRLVVQGG
jgi:ABC-2 type transport system permease protein